MKKINLRTTIFIFVSIFLIVTMVGVTYAKYFVSETFDGFATVARFGKITIKEHEAELRDGQYVLTENEISSSSKDGNTYNVVLPGVDIPKDPFFVVSGNFDVSYDIYVQIDEINFPKEVTYELNNNLVYDRKSDTNGKIYKYSFKDDTDVIDQHINILEGNKLIVSQSFKGNGSFQLIFLAWIEQKK